MSRSARDRFGDILAAGLRNIVIHEYIRVDPSLVADILDNELQPLAAELRVRIA